MENDFDIKGRVKEILALCKVANPYGTKTQIEADERFWALVRVLDGVAKDGQHPVNPGRFVRLPAKDSYAYYIVTRVTKKAVKLEHVPYGQAYQSNAVRDGEADVDVIERALAFHDRMDARFKELGRKPLEDKTCEYGIRNDDTEAELLRIMRLNGLPRAGALARLFGRNLRAEAQALAIEALQD